MKCIKITDGASGAHEDFQRCYYDDIDVDKAQLRGTGRWEHTKVILGSGKLRFRFVQHGVHMTPLRVPSCVALDGVIIENGQTVPLGIKALHRLEIDDMTFNLEVAE